MRLHSKKGVNPHMSVCCSCGEDTGVILFGAHEIVETCVHCKLTMYGGMNKRRGYCDKCSATTTQRKLEDMETVPGEMCVKCKDFYERLEREARESNAIIVRCQRCGMRAIVPGDNGLAKQAREAAPEYDHKVLGVDLTPEQCPQCREKNATKENA